jgi:DNA-binding MarR family transcriptional regulator
MKSNELQCACSAARQAARVLTQLYDSHLRASGLEAPQFALLMTIEMQGSTTNQAELGRRYSLDKTTVSRNLKLLEQKGWIERDGPRRFAITAEGRARLAAAKPQWKKAQAELRSGMSAQQWDDMFRVFQTINEAAQARGPSS